MWPVRLEGVVCVQFLESGEIGKRNKRDEEVESLEKV